MKNFLICAVLATALTIPVSLGIARMPWLIEWFNNGSGWDTLAPLLRAVGSIGVEEDENVFLILLLAASFVISMLVSATLLACVRRVTHQRGKRRPD
jgi:hypothetical protein